MGSCLSNQSAEEAVSNEIDKKLKSDRLKINNEVKLLLLGNIISFPVCFFLIHMFSFF